MRAQPHHAAGARPWAILLLSLGAVIAQASPALTGWASLRRADLADGQLWRLVSGHWTHWSADHLAWDLLVFAGAGAILERRGRRRLVLACTGLAAMSVGVGVWLLEPGIGEYRGLSGIGTALFTLATLDLLRDSLRSGHREQAVLLAAVLAASLGKVGFEAGTGRALFVDTDAAGFVSLPLAHLLGGAVAPLLMLADRRRAAAGVPYLDPIATSRERVRKNSVPSAIAGVAMATSPRLLTATSSKLAPAFTTCTSPSSLVK
jgi:rhomboid family GlyGly-CTERM serine protease